MLLPLLRLSRCAAPLAATARVSPVAAVHAPWNSSFLAASRCLSTKAAAFADGAPRGVSALNAAIDAAADMPPVVGCVATGTTGASNTATIAATGATTAAAPADMLQFMDDAVGRALDAGENVRSVGLGSYYTPSGWIENLVDVMHSGGCGWMSAIAAATIVVRSMLVPLQWVAQAKTTAFQAVQPEFQALRERMQSEYSAPSISPAAIDKLNRQMKDIQERGFNPRSMLKWTLLPLPIHFSLLAAVRSLTDPDCGLTGMATESFLWLPTAIVPDPLYILPAVTSLFAFCGIEISTYFSNLRMPMKPSRFIMYGLRMIPIVAFPVVSVMPAGFQVFVVSTAFVSLAQMLLIQHPKLRRFFKFHDAIPASSNTSNLAIKNNNAAASAVAPAGGRPLMTSNTAASGNSRASPPVSHAGPPTLIEEFYANTRRKSLFVELPKFSSSRQDDAAIITGDSKSANLFDFDCNNAPSPALDLKKSCVSSSSSSSSLPITANEKSDRQVNSRESSSAFLLKEKTIF